MREALQFIPDNENIFFHCKLKSVCIDKDYKNFSFTLLNLLKKKKPKSLIIPTYTYSFTKSSIFDRNSSQSEVGRFSEEIRLILSSKQRSLDPIFSCVDVLESGFVDNNIMQSSFDKNSIFYKWNKLNGIVVNFGLDDLFTTQFHFVERELQVNYREIKKFKGTIILNNSQQKIEYDFFCRKNMDNTFFNRKKLFKDMKKDNILMQKKFSNLNVMWFRSNDLFNFLYKKIKKDPNYLIS